MDFAVRAGTIDDVERLEPLWHALRDHHVTLPEMLPPRTRDESWAVRKRTSLSVLESERGSGVGQALTEAAAKVARDAGAEALFVGVAHSNEGAIRFYEREGFESFYVLLVRR